MKNLSKEEVRTAEEMFHASAKKQWLESPGFTPKMGSLGQVPHVCIPAIVELMEEYASQFKSKSEAVGWISVKDRLPELGGKVMVALSDGCVLTGRLYSYGWSAFFMDGEVPVIERAVTHWQPLPSPPEVSVGEEKKDLTLNQKDNHDQRPEG